MGEWQEEGRSLITSSCTYMLPHMHNILIFAYSVLTVLVLWQTAQDMYMSIHAKINLV